MPMGALGINLNAPSFFPLLRSLYWLLVSQLCTTTPPQPPPLPPPPPLFRCCCSLKTYSEEKDTGSLLYWNSKLLSNTGDRSANPPASSLQPFVTWSPCCFWFPSAFLPRTCNKERKHHLTQIFFFSPFFMTCRPRWLSKVSLLVADIGRGKDRIRTPRVFLSSSSALLLPLPPLACVAQSHGSRRPGRCSRPANWKEMHRGTRALKGVDLR